MHASTHANAHTFAHTYTHVEMAGAQRHVPPVSKRHDILALERKLVQRNDFMWVQLRLIQFVWLFCPKSALSFMRQIRNHGQISNHMNAFVPRKNALAPLERERGTDRGCESIFRAKDRDTQLELSETQPGIECLSYRMYQPVCCSVLQCVAVCCSVLLWSVSYGVSQL